MPELAIVHDYLTQTGGAERVVRTLSDLYPDSPIYTSVYHPQLTFPEFKERDVRTTFLQHVVPHGKFRLAAPLYGYAFSKLDLSEYDQVLVTTSGFAHHIRHPNAYVLCHTPPHFIYDLDEYLSPGLKRRAVEAAIPHCAFPINALLHSTPTTAQTPSLQRQRSKRHTAKTFKSSTARFKPNTCRLNSHLCRTSTAR